MLWLIVFAVVIIMAVLCFIYLISRFCKLNIISKITNNKVIKILISLGLIVAITAILCWSIGAINAIICLIHLAIIWIVCDLAFYFISKKIVLKRYYAGALAIITTIIYLAVGWILAYNVWETNYNIETNKNVGNLHIVQFADSHIGTTFDGDGFSKYVNKMQKLNPDVVLITGDFVDDDTSKEDMIKACKALGTLNTKYGVYFAFGNHDKGYYPPENRGYDGNDLINELEKNGVTVLQDESVLVDNRFYIVGRQDRSEVEKGGIRSDMSTLVKNLDSSKYIIVMDHQPNDYNNESNANVDLVLSGHTHGGQLLPINKIGQWIGANDKTYGIEKMNNTNFIVTSGISDWAVKFKTGCKSEYVVVDIHQ